MPVPADAFSRQNEPLVILHLAEVPPLAVEVHVRIDLHRARACTIWIFRVMAHEVEAEGIDLVVPRPVTRESSISLANMACSGAVLEQQVEFSTEPVSGLRRW